MEHFQTLPTDEDVKWDKLLDNILKSSDAILWGSTPASVPLPPEPPQPPPLPPQLPLLPLSPKEEPHDLPVTTAASEPKGAMELLPLAGGQHHLDLLMEGSPPDMDDELSNVLDDFWLPDYLGGQPGPINIHDQDDDVMVMPAHDSVNQPLLGRLIDFRSEEAHINGEMMCGASSSSDSLEVPTEASPTMSSKSQSYSHSQQEAHRPYIKKPPNAFMLFRKEQSPNVVAQFNITNSAAVNKILGKMWKSLPKKLQAKYYEQAEEHKILHSLQYPDWSCTENYGKKRKRDRTRHCTNGPKSQEDEAPVADQSSGAMGHAPGEDTLPRHNHKSVVGETHTYAHTRGC
ncbi:uncharacterized protein ACBT44_020339 [Syngnathus typhle]